MYSHKFSSKKHYLNYIDCLNKVEIGDEVDCLVNINNLFISLRSIQSFDNVGSSSFNRVVRLPIFGKREDQRKLEAFRPSMIGHTGNNGLQGYRPSRGDIGEYSILNRDKLLVYSNVNFDIVYTKIYKKVK